MESDFRALRVQKKDGVFSRSVETLEPKDTLPPGDLTVRVAYSSLNYKDALSATGNPGVTKTYPHTPGIDAAGTVLESADERFSVGDEVIVTSYDLGMNTPGGFGELIRVPADWAVPLPAGLTLREAMVLGTAGLTAGLCLDALLAHGLEPGQGPVVVTGASGGVGSVVVALFATSGLRDAGEYRHRGGARLAPGAGRGGHLAARRTERTGGDGRCLRRASPGLSTRWGANRCRTSSSRSSTAPPSPRVGWSPDPNSR